jgi:N-acetylneuraminic acid mutarotase
MLSWLSLMPKSASARQKVHLRQKRPGSLYQPLVETLETRHLLSTLPLPWADRDIGDVGLAGSATQANNIYSIQGSGADIFDTRDAFHFVYQPLIGDGEIVARVTSVGPTDAWAKAGVMIRESLSPHAAQAMMVLTPAMGSSFQDRASTAGTTSFTTPTDPTSPWVRIVRSGNAFTGYRSANGHDWIQSGSATIPMSSTAYVGLAVTSHNNSQLNTSTFDHVTPSLRSSFAWSTLAPLPAPRFEGNTSVVNDRLYVFGGYYDAAIHATTEVDRYDPNTNTWAVLSDMPVPLTHCGVAVDGSTVYLAGGFVGDYPGPGGTNRVLTYDVLTDRWNDAPPLPEARAAGALVRLGRTLHYFGGQDAARQTDKADHWVLNLDDPSSGWTRAADLPNPRDHLGAVALNGKAYAVGGQHLDEVSTNQTEVDAYDPATDTWTQVAALPVPTGHNHQSTFVRNGRIVVAGGETNGGQFLADAREYDPDLDSWVALPSLPQPRQAGDAQQIEGRIYFTGGRATDGTPTTTTWAGDLTNTWETAAPMPIPLGEVAGGVIGHTLYLVGEGSPATLAYDLATNTWTSAGLATRPFVGNHHAAEVYNGKLYLLGGLSGGAEGKVQIYDPVSNTWTRGADMPFAAGSSASALINGEIYVAGGIVGSDTTDQVAKYNPATDTWTPLAHMPQGRNHTAAATDGVRLYVFGGRIGPNVVANGFDTVEIYDPNTDTWTSTESGSGITPLPQARGGMGKAVFYNGEFYVLGGETLNGALATAANVYNRVDIYNPVTNSWRLGPIMPTARHGIFPLAYAGRIYVAGGGVQSGGSQSAVVEVFNGDQHGPGLPAFADAGFELPPVGTGPSAYQYNPTGSPWTYTGHAGVAGNGSTFTAGNPNAPEGTQVAFLQDYGSMSQLVPFGAGMYRISFSAAQRAANVSRQVLQVLVDENVVGTVAPTGTSYAAYTTSNFPATAGVHTITFVGTDPDGGDNTILLDQMQFNRVIAGYGFELPNVGTGPGAIAYDPTGTPLRYTGNAGIAGNGSTFSAGNPDAPQGTQVGFLQDYGSFSVSGSIAAGAYTISFSAAQRAANVSRQTFQVLVDGVAVGTFTPANSGYAAYVTANFTLTAGVHTIAFVGLDPDGQDNTVFLDQLALNLASL